MFKRLYDFDLQGMTTSWAAYIQKNPEVGVAFRDMFYDNMYRNAFFILIFMSLISGLIFYMYLNAKFGTYYVIGRYLITMLINSVLILGITYTYSHQVFRQFSCPTGSHIFSLSLINACFGIIVFFSLSLMLKWFSPMGKRTPF